MEAENGRESWKLINKWQNLLQNIYSRTYKEHKISIVQNNHISLTVEPWEENLFKNF